MGTREQWDMVHEGIEALLKRLDTIALESRLFVENKVREELETQRFEESETGAHSHIGYVGTWYPPCAMCASQNEVEAMKTEPEMVWNGSGWSLK